MSGGCGLGRFYTIRKSSRIRFKWFKLQDFLSNALTKLLLIAPSQRDTVTPSYSNLTNKKKCFFDVRVLSASISFSMSGIRGFSNPKQLRKYTAKLSWCDRF